MAFSFLRQRWLHECTMHVRLSFKDDPNTFFDTATSDEDIAAAAMRMLLGVFAFGTYPIPLLLGVLTAHAIFGICVSQSLDFRPRLPLWRPMIYPMKKIATHWSIREVDPGTTTVVTAEFCLVAPRVKTGLNVTNNGACQRLNSEQMSTARAIVLYGNHSNVIKK